MSTDLRNSIALSERVEQMAESKTIRMSQKSRELKDQGKDIINLSLGEPDFSTPDYIKEAAIQAIRDGYTHYPPVGGFADLKEAIVNKLKNENDLDYQPSEVMVSNGAKHSIINVLLALVNPGDEVLTPVPYWVSYPEMIKISGGKMVTMDTDATSDFKITPQQLEQSITDKTRAIIFNSPSNPSGAVYDQEEMDALAEVLRKHPHVYIISDEIYEHINFVGEHHTFAGYDDLKDRVIVINGVSKGYAMTGWRIGYMAGDQRIIKACEKLQGQFTSAPNSISQKAAVAALNGGNHEALKMRDEFQKRRDFVLKDLKEIPGIKLSEPGGAFYFFPEIKDLFGSKNGDQTIEDSEQFCFYVLENYGVSLVPGDAFGANDCIRISYAASEESLEKGVKAIKEAVNNLR